MGVRGNFCVVSDVGVFKRSALRTALNNLIDSMKTIDPGGQYVYTEKKGIFKSTFAISGRSCTPKHVKFFITVIKPRIPELYDSSL